MARKSTLTLSDVLPEVEEVLGSETPEEQTAVAETSEIAVDFNTVTAAPVTYHPVGKMDYFLPDTLLRIVIMQSSLGDTTCEFYLWDAPVSLDVVRALVEKHNLWEALPEEAKIMLKGR